VELLHLEIAEAGLEQANDVLGLADSWRCGTSLAHEPSSDLEGRQKPCTLARSDSAGLE
jgi:hypothetical protein